MENNFKQLKEYPQKDGQKAKFYLDLQNFFSQEHHSLYPQVNTENNVGFNTLNKILKSFCLESFDKHWKQYTHPNSNLEENLRAFLRYRNGVAHGGDVSSEEKITQEVYAKYKLLVSDLMYEMYNKMTNGLKNKTYLKAVINENVKL
jgi:hypothetical protein